MILRTDQKIKLMEICLAYAVPKMVYKAEIRQADQPKTITVIDSNGK